MNAKEQLHQLVDLLPESRVNSVKQYIEQFLHPDEHLSFDTPLNDTEIAESESAWRDYLEGNDSGIPLEQAIQQLSNQKK